MREHRYVAIAILLVSLGAACGGGAEDTEPRQRNTLVTRPTATVVAPETQVGPPPQNMPGGGRGNDPPHFKGKP
jgi:hypothetical protein